MTATIDRLVKKGKKLAHKKAAATKRAYASDLKQFRKWCAAHGVQYLPSTPEIIIAYIVDRSDDGAAVATITRAVCAISQAHKSRKYDNAALDHSVTATLAGLKRDRGTAQKRAKPILTAQLARMLHKCERSIAGKRDAALLALGWSCALRSAELVALRTADLDVQPEGLICTVRRSKTDQEAAGRKIGIPFADDSAEFCPVTIVQNWLSLAHKPGVDNPVFFRLQKGAGKDFFNFKPDKKALSTKSVTAILRAAMVAAGYDFNGYSSHSLRAGFCTSAATAGVPEWAIARHTGHNSEKILKQYIRDGTLFRHNPLVALLGSKTADPNLLPEKSVP